MKNSSLLASLAALIATSFPPFASSFALFRGTNRLFLDTAVESEWKSLLPLGIFHGITTNPTLLERAGHECTIESVQSLTKHALGLPGCDEFMCQAWGSSADEMYAIGMKLSAIDRDRVVIKVPVTFEGSKAASKMIDSNVRVCLTACYSSDQAIVAAGLGAEYLGMYFSTCSLLDQFIVLN